jgi:hypothetical protein
MRHQPLGVGGGRDGRAHLVGAASSWSSIADDGEQENLGKRGKGKEVRELIGDHSPEEYLVGAILICSAVVSFPRRRRLLSPPSLLSLPSTSRNTRVTSWVKIPEDGGYRAGQFGDGPGNSLKIPEK